ncbi:hypothetical protein Val02_64330 [Virgisporangium aliadipatigenens]|uniref:Uncharacterized protein n=1 Tax=Virgisporangium aliadipatigenens TaxID=741659 RepID=A0A8J3YRY1_9ACTN|nr:hypothetical protein [Virgisporangium aliadipatigenens]GIJ49547.1 hypothetical protein Val02_64330 [Virgisporangium aliadipatigenens]
MTHGMRQLLTQELAEEYSPPIGDLVRAAIDQGEHLRYRRRVGVVAGAVAAVVTLAVAFGLLLSVTDGTSSAPDRYAVQPAESAVQPSPSPSPLLAKDGLTFAVPAVSSGPTVVATWAASLELLDRLLPGTHSGQAWGEGEATPGSTFVQTYVDKGQGPGMIRLGVAAFSGSLDECGRGQRCYEVPGVGRVAIDELPENCVQSKVVSLFRDDGVYLQLNLGTCLAWDGTRNPEGRMVLTEQEAIDVVLDPRWGVRMPTDLVSIGAAKFGSAPKISGG